MTRHLPWLVTLGAALLLAVTRVLDVGHAVLLPAALLACWYAWKAVDDGVQARWPAPPEESRHGGRADISELGWAAFTRDGRVSARITHRVRALASRRLAAHGVDLDDPGQHRAAARLLGDDVVTGLVDRSPPTARTLHRWLDAIDSLTPEPQRTGRPRR
jgi:hypothetical protein